MLGTKAPFLYDLNLILQIAILILVLVGSFFAKNKNYMKHGKIMTVAIALHTVLILLVMGPSFLVHLVLLLPPTLNSGVFVTWFHVLLGILAEALGLFVVIKWRLDSTSISACA